MKRGEKERKEDRILLFAICFFLQFSIYNEWINPLLKNNRSIKLIESIFMKKEEKERKEDQILPYLSFSNSLYITN